MEEIREDFLLTRCVCVCVWAALRGSAARDCCIEIGLRFTPWFTALLASRSLARSCAGRHRYRLAPSRPPCPAFSRVLRLASNPRLAGRDGPRRRAEHNSELMV